MAQPTHWLVDLINHVHPGTLPPDALPMDANPVTAWQMLKQNRSLSVPFIARTLADSFGLKIVDARQLTAQSPNPLPEAFCRKWQIVPFDLRANPPLIATADPRMGPEQRDQIRFMLGKEFELAIVPPDAIDTALTFLYSSANAASGKSARVGGAIDLEVGGTGDAPMVQLAKALFREGIDKRASDIHLHPFVGGAAIRFRVDGVLQRIATIPKTTLQGLCSYFIAQAGLESNPMIPQDGRLSLNYGSRHFDLRLSILPAYDGPRIVCRLLEQGKQFSLDRSGFSEPDRQRLLRLAHNKSGIVLMTGPTGSGKTTTLYTLLTEVNTFEVNVVTLEDPVEYVLPGISQIQVNKLQGRSFADSLRAVLRQDPDVVLIGEIRDGETAQIAVQASLTGHLVFSTLHTNDALSVIPRLLDLDIQPTLLADTLVGVISQRLVRRLCDQCRSPTTEPLTSVEAEFQRISGANAPYRAVGCAACHFSGYSGRLPLTEILEVSPEMRHAMLNGQRDILALKEAAQSHCTSMMLGAAQRIMDGHTTPAEIDRELGLKFWNELGLQHHAEFLLPPSVSSSTASTGQKPAVLLVCQIPDWASALSNQLPFQCVVADSIAMTDESLAQHPSISAIVMDLSLLHGSPMNWLEGLRAQRAWAGVPVLFVQASGEIYFSPQTDPEGTAVLELEPDDDAPWLIAHRLSEMLALEY